MTTDRRSNTAAVLIAVVVMLLPVGYVLSVGPAVWLHAHGYLSDEALVVYEPLELVYDKCQPIQPMLDRYVELWQ